MANYKKLTDVEVMEEVSENTMALVEDNGKLKKVPCGAGFGGGNGIATAIIKGNFYSEFLTGISTTVVENETYTCSNMTFEEARDIILAGDPLDAILMRKDTSRGYYFIVHPRINITHLFNGIPCIVFYDEDHYSDSYDSNYTEYCYWTAEGFQFNDPNAPL